MIRHYGLPCLAVLSLAAACTAAPSTPAYEGFAPCADAGDYPALAGSLCRVESVPLHPAREGDVDTISLFVRLFPERDLQARRGTVWLVAGGPGESGASFYPVLDEFRSAFAGYDLMIPDHRGTGYSDKLCPEEESPDSADGIALAGQEWGSCIGHLFADPGRVHGFTITNAAHDLSTLITRHREPGEVLVYAVSYGTQLALRMMQVAPAALDGLVLDGLVSAEGTPEADLSRRTEVVDAVGRDLLTPEDMAAYARLLQTDTASAGWAGSVPGGDLRRFMGALLNFPTLRDRIPALIETLGRGETGLLDDTAAELERLLATLAGYPQSPPSLPLVMLISGSENNERRDLTADTVAAEAADALFTSPLPGLLVGIPAPLYERDAFFGGSPASLPRILVIHGTHDPNTPYEGARAHAERLADAGEISFTTVEGGAHFLPFVAQSCFVRAVSAFVGGADTLETCRP